MKHNIHKILATFMTQLHKWNNNMYRDNIADSDIILQQVGLVPTVLHTWKWSCGVNRWIPRSRKMRLRTDIANQRMNNILPSYIPSLSSLISSWSGGKARPFSWGGLQRGYLKINLSLKFDEGKIECIGLHWIFHCLQSTRRQRTVFGKSSASYATPSPQSLSLDHQYK